MTKPLIISLLRFASSICNNKDIRAFCNVVFTEYDQGNTVIYSTNGHVAIRIVVPNQEMQAHTYTIKSIDNAYKTGLETLLEPVIDEIRRPPIEKIFAEATNKFEDNKIGLDVNYLYLISSGLIKLSKDLGTKARGIEFHKTSKDKANFIRYPIYTIENELIEVLIAIMPMKL